VRKGNYGNGKWSEWNLLPREILHLCPITVHTLQNPRLGVKATTLKEGCGWPWPLVASKAKAKNGVKANVNMVRCSVKTSKHRRLLQGW